MAKFFFTNKAVEDLSSIWNYTRIKWSEKQADKYYISMLEICQEVADNPNLAKEYNQIINGLLGIRANRHTIFFRILSSFCRSYECFWINFTHLMMLSLFFSSVIGYSSSVSFSFTFYSGSFCGSSLL